MWCYFINRILPILAYVGAPSIILMIWYTPLRRTVMGDSLTRCLIWNFVVLLLGAALVRWRFLGPLTGTLNHDDPLAVLGAVLLIVTNLAFLCSSPEPFGHSSVTISVWEHLDGFLVRRLAPVPQGSVRELICTLDSETEADI